MMLRGLKSAGAVKDDVKLISKEQAESYSEGFYDYAGEEES